MDGYDDDICGETMTYEFIKFLPDSIYNREGNIKKLLDLFVSQLSSIDEVLQGLSMIRDINNANGAVLDLIGEILRENRKGYDDASYRLFLLIAVQKLLCNGSLSSMANILHAILKDDLIGVWELTPQDKQYLYIDRKSYIDGSWFLDGTRWLSGEQESINSPYEIYLDGSSCLDGNWYLSHTVFQPAFFEIVVADAVTEDSIQYINNIVHYIKPAGVRYRIRKLEE